MDTIPISVLIPCKNEERNIGRCLRALEGWADEILVIDSHSADRSVEIAEEFGATILQFEYHGGWPKKRQWVLDTYDFRNDWIFLLDADEIPTPELKCEIEEGIKNPNVDGYYIHLEIEFLNRRLRYGGFEFYKLNLFRKGKGRFEKRIDRHTKEMSDMEVHEHVYVKGKTKYLKHAIAHCNVNNIYRYLDKHNAYSTWEAEVMYRVKYGSPAGDEMPPTLLDGSQAQRKRWFKNKLFFLPGFSLFTFIYHYILRLGFLDGIQGLIYCRFQSVFRFASKVKFKELEMERKSEKKNKPFLS